MHSAQHILLLAFSKKNDIMLHQSQISLIVSTLKPKSLMDSKGGIIIHNFIEILKKIIKDFRIKVKNLKKEIGALSLACKRRDVPWYSKFVILLVVGYALSPIDLIPDFIPVLGYLDDFILAPIGVAFAIRLIPKDIMNECREQSENIFKQGKPKNWVAGGIIIFIWIGIFTYFLTRVL